MTVRTEESEELDPNLEVDPADESAEENGGDGDGTDDTGIDVAALQEQIVTAVTEATSTEIDRRVTSLMKTLRNEYGLQKPKAPEGDNGGSEPVSNVSNQRVLRAALRDRVSLEFDDKEERKLAASLAKQIGESRGLGDSEDEDDVAEAIVDQVKDVLGKAREQYSTATRSDLERRGLLKDELPGQNQSGKKNSQGPSAKEQFDAGRKRANEEFAAKE